LLLVTNTRDSIIRPDITKTVEYLTMYYTFYIFRYFIYYSDYKKNVGRAIAEAVSRWLPTAAARARTRIWQVGFVVDKVASGQVFSEYFGFPC
jgi:hypothetical protein